MVLPPQLNTISVEKDLDYLKRIPDGFVDSVVTSPPYNIRNSSGNSFKHPPLSGWHGELVTNGYDGYADDLPEDEYIDWQRQVMRELLRVINPKTGVIFYNHKWRVQNGLYQRHAEKIIGDAPLRQIIIWRRSGGVNHNRGYFLPSYEVIYIIAMADFTFVEGSSGLTDVWDIPQASGTEHPAPFPLELASRCIRTTNAQVILDPYMGSGTVAEAALKHKRCFLGCDRSGKYVEMANRRIAEFPTDKPLKDGVVQLSLFGGAS